MYRIIYSKIPIREVHMLCNSNNLIFIYYINYFKLGMTFYPKIFFAKI